MNAQPRIAARSSTGLKNMAAFFVSRAERTNDVALCAYEVADILKEAAYAIKMLERERDEANAQMCQAIGYLSTIAEDCEAWLNGESDEPSMEFIKAIRDWAKKKVLGENK